MPLVGGGGSPNVSGGATFTGPSTSLETIGDFAYAYSGEFTANTSTQTVLTFTTGAFHLVGRVRLASFVDMGSPATGAQGACRIKLNGSTVIDLMTDGGDKDMTFSDHADIIIPPFTKFVAEVDSNTTADVDGTVSLTGRIY